MSAIKRRTSRRTVVVRLILISAIAAVVVFGLTGVPRASLQGDNRDAKNYDQYLTPDAATVAVRDRRNSLHQIAVHNAADREAAAKLGVVVEDYGQFVVVATDASRDLSRVALETSRIQTTVNLPGKAFEPTENPGVETVPPGENSNGKAGGGEGNDKDYYVVQFAGPIRDEWLDSLRAIGVEVLQYVPHQAYFVYGDRTAMHKVAGHSRVRWVGRYDAESRISPELREQVIAQLRGNGTTGKMQALEMRAGGRTVFDVAVFGRADLERVRAAVINVTGGTVRHAIRLPNNFFNVLRVEIPLDSVFRIADIPDVVRIDPYFTPATEDERAAMIVAGNYTSTTTITPPGYNPLTQFGVDGQNVTVSVVDDGVGIPGDGGFYITATNTIDGPLRGAPAGANGHGHLNASIIAGNTPFSTLDPTGYNYGLGIAPKANIVNIPFLRGGYTGNEANTVDDTVATSGPNVVKASISNNSWGNGTNGNAYDSYAGMYDGFVQDASVAGTIDPILLVFSAGNSGGSGLTRPKVAKNLIAVANSENLRTELSATGANNIDDLNSTSSRGPASDGRIKPDITAPGSGISGGRSGPDALFGNIDTFHRWSVGTSHAAPQVAGAAALFTQFWKNGHGGANPSPALVKAAIINTGQEMNGVGTAATIPNGAEGWGRMNMKFLLNTGVPITYVDQTMEFGAAGTSVTLVGRVADGTKPLRFSLVWTDPPAAVSPALINNLDLTVTVGASVYRGNVFSGGVSATGGSADTLNNVENVFIPAGVAAGTAIAIQISATAINGNGILGNADATDQHFGLVAYNFTASTQPPPSDFDGDNRSDVAVFRPTGGTWYISQSSNGAFRADQFGVSTDQIVPADFDGDRKTDLAVFRPSIGTWYFIESQTGTFRAQQFGQNGDFPYPADFDGDGKADLTVFRPSTGTWYILQSASSLLRTQAFGTNGDKPVVGDYDGDAKSDVAVYRPSTGTWYVLRSSDGGFLTQPFGNSTDQPVQGDYDGDGKTDVSVFRPSTGTWYLLRSSNGAFSGTTFGQNGDTPAVGDFDGDGKTDLTVFRGSTGTWYLLQSILGFKVQAFGANGDRPVASAYVQ